MERWDIHDDHPEGGPCEDTYKVPLVGDGTSAEGICDSGFDREDLE
jgi:hypothetical protein